MTDQLVVLGSCGRWPEAGRASFRVRWYGHENAPAIPLYAPECVIAQIARMGPFRLESRALLHWVPNAGVRLTADGVTLACSGDTWP